MQILLIPINEVAEQVSSNQALIRRSLGKTQTYHGDATVGTVGRAA